MKVKEFGEVFTPVELVNEMLDTLPEEVWTNPDLTWLDPAAGSNMIFPIEVYKRLMRGLKEAIPNEIERDEHIWENMLYMVEIQEESVKIGKEKILEAREKELFKFI